MVLKSKLFILAVALAATIPFSAAAQFDVHPTFNGAIVNGPTSMAITIGNNATGQSDTICGITPESDWDTEQLLILDAAKQCSKARQVIDNDIEAVTLVSPKDVANTAAGASLLFTFEPSPYVRRETVARIVAQTRRTDPATADRLEAVFERTDVIEQFGPGLAGYGLKANNVADAFAFWWASAWEVVNDRTVGDPRKIFPIVSRQASNLLLASPQFLKASEAQKQEMAETFILQAFLIVLENNAAEKDPARRALLAQSVNRGAMALDPTLDLSKMVMTPEGFQRPDRRQSNNQMPNKAIDVPGVQQASEGGRVKNAILYGLAGSGMLIGLYALGKGVTRRG